MVDLDVLADRHERLRDRHQSMFAEPKKTAGVVLVADPKYIGTFSGQVTWATLLNLSARLYKGVRAFRLVLDPGVARLSCVFFPNTAGDLLGASVRLLEELNNGNAFTIEEGAPANDGSDWIWVHVGAQASEYPAGITVAGQGWAACVNDQAWRSLPSAQNPIGPFVAACLGAAEIYKTLYPLRENKKPAPIVLSAFDYSNDVRNNPPLPETVKLPETSVAGAGAVGMAFLALLNSIPAIKSSDGLHVVEYDDLDGSNMNRCLLAVLRDVGEHKTNVLKTRLDVQRLSLQVHEGTWEAFVDGPAQLDPKKLELVISCVDKYGAREAVQYKRLPKLLVTAGTGDFLLSVSRHVLDDGLSCGLCYQARDQGTMCAEATDGAQQAFEVLPDPSISFVSGLAGALLAAEYVKEVIPDLRAGRIQNTLRVQVLTASTRVSARSKDARCNCSSKYVSIGYKQTWPSEGSASKS